MDGCHSQAFGPGTRDARAALAERHKGVPGGCRCRVFHEVSHEGRKKDSDVARRARKRAMVAVRQPHAALDQIAAAGGGTVEAFPEAIEGQKTSARFLRYGTFDMFERSGFAPTRKIGKHRWVARRRIEGATR